MNIARLLLAIIASLGLLACQPSPNLSASDDASAAAKAATQAVAEANALETKTDSAPPASEPAEATPPSYWQVQGGAAVLTLQMPDAPRPNVYSALVVAHRPESGCKSEIAVAITQGRSYGKPTQQVRASSNLRLVIDNDTSWTDTTFITQYEHAQERGFWASDDLINTLPYATVVHATLGDGLHTIEFPVSGAGEAIARAMDNCRALQAAP